MHDIPFPFGKVPPGVKWLLGLNGLFFLLQQFFPGTLESYLGLVSSQVLFGFQFWRLVTYLFLHGSFFHILFNLFTLWMFGKEIEMQWGTKEFIKFYFICGLGAALLNVLVEPFSTTPVIGASGALYGVLVAFALTFPTALIYLYGIIPVQSKHFVLLIGFVEFLASFRGTSSTIARFAHLGGMLTGYFYLKSYEFRSILHRFFHRVTDWFVIRKKEPEPQAAQQSNQEDLAKDVDRILEKVLLKGADSLTPEERELMRRYSSMKH